MRCCVDCLVGLLARSALADLQTDRIPVAVADVPGYGVARRHLVYGAVARPVADPLRHVRVVADSVPVLHMVPSGRARVARGVHHEVLWREGAMTARDDMVGLLPRERRCRAHRERRCRAHREREEKRGKRSASPLDAVFHARPPSCRRDCRASRKASP